MLPETLGGWTLELLAQLLASGVHENERLEFKERLPHSSDGGAMRRLRHTIAAFANADGGFLVIGIHDDATRPVRERLLGRPGSEEVPTLFASVIATCQPSLDVSFLTPPLRLETGNVVHVVHIPRSSRGPHGFFGDERWCFPKRVPGATAAMTYAELRSAFVDHRRERAVALRLCRDVERMHATAERLNARCCNGAAAEVARELIAAPYRAQRLEATSGALFDQIGANEYLVKQLDDLVEAAHASDEFCQRFAQAEQLGMLDHAVLPQLVREYAHYARRVMSNAYHLLPQLRKVLHL